MPQSGAASAAIVTALLQGKPACKQQNSGTKQVKTTPKWLRGLKAENNRSILMAAKIPVLFWEVMQQKQKEEHKQGWFPITHCYKKIPG